MSKIYYICDGKACEHCNNDDCHFTNQIEHAVNFRKVDADEYVEKYKPVSIPVQWLNNYNRALANKLIKDYNKSLDLVSPFNDD